MSDGPLNWKRCLVPETDEERKEGDDRLNVTVLAVIGWILPLAGLVYGPGQWWVYIIWLAIGTALLVAYETMRGSSS